MTKLALGSILKNEVQNLPVFLASFKGCVDKIYLTDTGSTDGSLELIQSYIDSGENPSGAPIELSHFVWINDFSAARNFNLQQVEADKSNEFYMWADLDDSLGSPENFIQWKNHAMNLADYWLATYHYAFNGDRPTCSFIRERAFRLNRGLKWSYFIHEGVKGVSETGVQLRHQFIPTWTMNHRRTAEDLARDKGRNLSIFESNLSQKDARMRYYYAKELFEAQKPLDAIPVFFEALSNKELELHDRILGHQYMAACMMQTEKFDQAIHFCLLGLELAPTRAEFFVMIADGYLKKGMLAESLPFLHAAMNSPQRAMNAPTPIFSTPQAYEEYPRVQLARVYANLGDFPKAKAVANEAIEKFNNEEAKGILLELNKLTAPIDSLKDAKPCSDIVFTTPPQTAYEFDPGQAKLKAMGGSETALIEMAKWLHIKTGQKVIVFNMRQSSGMWDGVEYRPTGELQSYFSQHKPQVHIAWRHTVNLTDAPTYIWSHDLQTQGVESTTHYEKVMCLTPFHKEYMKATQGVADDKIMLTRNGILPERFKGVDYNDKDPNLFVFPNSPDRGLDRVMLVLDKVRLKHPEVKLNVYYGIEHLPRWGHQALHDKLKSMMDARPWVNYKGATQQDELIADFKKAAYYVGPSDWIETSQILGMELALSGVYCIFRGIGGAVNTMAPWTVRGMATQVNSEATTEAELQNFVDATNDAIEKKAYQFKTLDAEKFGWDGVADDWIKQMNLTIQNQSGAL